MTVIDPARPPHLALVSSATRTPWGADAQGLPGAAQVALPTVKRFSGSRFSLLVSAVAKDCLGDCAAFADPPTRRTGIVLATMFGDTAVLDASILRIMDGQAHNPLLLYQSLPTAILGHLAELYRITGPVTCISGAEDLARDTLSTARTLLGAHEVDQVLAIAVECAPNERAAWVHAELSDATRIGRLPAGDVATALLLRAQSAEGGLPWSIREDAPEPADPAWTAAFGWLAPLVALANPVGQDAPA